jgi:predicted negative regulator of RcsB-dependent stress response
LLSKEGTVSTTKLSRKEIVAEDNVHKIIIWLFTVFRENRAKIGIAVLAVVIVGVGGYLGYRYLDSRDLKGQEQLAKGIEFFYATVAPDATADPYGKGPTPTFRNDNEKYKAAADVFSSITSGFSYGSTSVIAHYYLGLSQLQLGHKQEAVKILESVANDSKNRTVGYLAKSVLASIYFDLKNFQGARDNLEGMIKDVKCDLPKEELSIQLSRVLMAQGKSADAIKVLREANDRSAAFGDYKQQVVAEMDKLQKSSVTGTEQKLLKP